MSSLCALHTDVLIEILQYLKVQDVVRLQRVDKSFHRRFARDPDVWKAVNGAISRNYGQSFAIDERLSWGDAASMMAVRKLVTAPYRYRKRLKTVSTPGGADNRSTYHFPSGYVLQCMAVIPGGRWLVVGSRLGYFDIWDLSPVAPFTQLSQPVCRLPHRWLVSAICLHPEGGDFLAVVAFRPYHEQTDDSDLGASSSRNDDPHCAVVRIMLPTSHDAAPSIAIRAQTSSLGPTPLRFGDLIVADTVGSKGARMLWNWVSDVTVPVRYSRDEVCRSHNRHQHRPFVHAKGHEITTLCHPRRMLHTFRIPDYVLSHHPWRISRISSRAQIPMSGDIDEDPEQGPDTLVDAIASDTWSVGRSGILHLEYSTCARPDSSTHPEYFVDICPWRGMFIGFINRRGSSGPEVVTEPVRFYNTPLDGAVAISPMEDEVLVLITLATTHPPSRSVEDAEEGDWEHFRGVDELEGSAEGTNSSLGSNPSEDHGEERAIRGESRSDWEESEDEEVVDVQTLSPERSEGTITIVGFIIPVAGILARNFSNGSEHSNLIKAFSLTENLYTPEELVVLWRNDKHLLDKMSYDILSGRIVLTTEGSKGVIVLSFDEARAGE